MAYKKWASVEDRFWSKVEIKGPQKCWLWGAATKSGYGSFMLKTNGKWWPVPAHRFSYELAFGIIPEGLHIDHKECQNKLCVNPFHLEAVTQAENNRRMNMLRNNLGQLIPKGSSEFFKSRRSHCRKGHEFIEETTYIRKNGVRECRLCINLREVS